MSQKYTHLSPHDNFFHNRTVFVNESNHQPKPTTPHNPLPTISYQPPTNLLPTSSKYASPKHKKSIPEACQKHQTPKTYTKTTPNTLTLTTLHNTTKTKNSPTSPPPHPIPPHSVR